MSAPVKMGIVVTQPTDFIERNPATVEYTRRSMARDIVDSGRLPDQASWKREEIPREMYDMVQVTRFSLDAVSEAHVIVLVEPDGRHTWTGVHEVQLGSLEQAQARVHALNEEHGCYLKYDESDGEWWGKHYAVETVPLGYATPEVQAPQEFRSQGIADRQRAIRIGTERMRG